MANFNLQAFIQFVKGMIMADAQARSVRQCPPTHWVSYDASVSDRASATRTTKGNVMRHDMGLMDETHDALWEVEYRNIRSKISMARKALGLTESKPKAEKVNPLEVEVKRLQAVIAFQDSYIEKLEQEVILHNDSVFASIVPETVKIYKKRARRSEAVIH